MTDPSELIRRASELSERAEQENDAEVKDRLLRMAARYASIAESEEWLAAHPTSIASLGNILAKSE